MSPLDQRDPGFVLPDQITVRLKRPLKPMARDELLDEIVFRCPTAGDIKRISAKGIGVEGGLYSLYLLQTHKLTALDVENLTAIDAEICIEALSPFLGLRPRSEAETA